MENTVHKCDKYESGNFDDHAAYGPAFGSHMYFDEVSGENAEPGRYPRNQYTGWFLGNGEYESRMRFCPFCGLDLYTIRNPEEEYARTDDDGSRKICTTSGTPIDASTREIDPATGMQQDYIVLCEDERKKGFVRPYRDSYRHVGQQPQYPTRKLTEEEQVRYKDFGYAVFEEYPETESLQTGRFWTQAQLNSGCETVTTMGRALSETFARDPKFYGGTFCCACKAHFPLAEFVWTVDGQMVGS